MYILLLLYFFSFSIPEEASTCSDLRTGKFVLVSEKLGTTIITRTNNRQEEINQDYNVKVRYKVKWINECTYQLFEGRYFSGRDFFEGEETDTMTVEITEISKEFYKVLTSSNLGDNSIEARLKIID
jgi:hypothetical protein